MHHLLLHHSLDTRKYSKNKSIPICDRFGFFSEILVNTLKFIVCLGFVPNLCIIYIFNMCVQWQFYKVF